MSSQATIDREVMAIAACDVAGLPRPLTSGVPERDRVYLYACGAEGARHSCEDLSREIADAGIPHAVEWDREKENFGLRFVSSGQSLPASLKRYTSDDARSEWVAEQRLKAEMSEKVSEAAASAARGEEVVFLDDDRIVDLPKDRRRKSSLGERD